LVGVIPENLRWGVKLLGGLKGDIPSGLAKLSNTYNRLDDKDIFKKETGIIYASLNLNLTNPTELFIKSNLAHYMGKNDLTIKMLSSYRRQAGVMPFEYLNYMLGVAKLNRLDKDADRYFLRFLKNFKGQYYIKDAYLRLAWHALIQGRIIEYDQYLGKVKSEGSSDINYDKTALKRAYSTTAVTIKRPTICCPY